MIDLEFDFLFDLEDGEYTEENTDGLIDEPDFTSSSKVSATHTGATYFSGYSSCYVSTCHCPGFSGNENTCYNCGHSYRAHY